MEDKQFKVGDWVTLYEKENIGLLDIWGKECLLAGNPLTNSMLSVQSVSLVGRSYRFKGNYLNWPHDLLEKCFPAEIPQFESYM